MWHDMSQKFGTNATGLSRVLPAAFTTSWFALHKLRWVMVRADREKLGPVVEVDESYIGGLEEGKFGRGAEKKSLIMVAVELDSEQKRMGRIRLATIPNASSSSLLSFINET
jgi:hypothetical protein